MSNNIKIVEEFLKKEFARSTYFIDHEDEKTYRLEHTYRVANIGKEIAEKEKMDVEAMVIACLLHDVSYSMEFKKKEDWLNHGRDSAKIAKKVLDTLDIPKETLQDICYGVAIHVDGKADFEGEQNKFTISISDADNIDRFDAYRIYENLQSANFSKMSFKDREEYINNNITKLEKYKNEEFATKTATEMWREKIEFQILFFKKLKMQMMNSQEIN